MLISLGCSRRMLALCLIGLSIGVLGACATTPAPSAAAPAADGCNLPGTDGVSGSASAQAPVASLHDADMVGLWAEFWSPAGHADTQRYVFLADGRFGWLAPTRDTPKMDPLQRSGHFRMQNSALSLDVDRERFAACASGCGAAEQAGQPGQPRVVTHAPAMTITLEVGECPPNQEAQHLDSGYVCRSIGGQAFWRRADNADAEAPPFMQ